MYFSPEPSRKRFDGMQSNMTRGRLAVRWQIPMTLGIYDEFAFKVNPFTVFTLA